MAANSLNSLSMPKYGRLLPRMFPEAVRFEIRDRLERMFWSSQVASSTADHDTNTTAGSDAVIPWTDCGDGLGRRQLASGEVEFRAALKTDQKGEVAWLIVAFDTRHSVPLATASESLRRTFADALAFMHEEIELQSECNQLAVELTERYEELNLVYATKDQVEYLEEGQEALVRLVHNCADYLDVGLAALICRDRGLLLHQVNAGESSTDIEQVLDLLRGKIYDRVESQVLSLVLNDEDDEERARIFSGRSENLVAQPVIDNHGTAIGVLAVVARRGVHTFSNGDRNLLEVMAKKASRIIHTHHDSLTGLMNRSGFESSLVGTLSNARNKNLQHCLLYIDIDQLHLVNDLLGNQEGDNLIRRVSKVLRNSVRDSDYVARLGGDEFAVLLSNCTTEQGRFLAEKILKSIRKLAVISSQRQLDVSASIGVAPLTPETDGIVGLMASVEIACKAAKDAGRDQVEVFQQDNTTLVRRSEEIEWVGRVQQAIREDKFVLFCQPVMPLANENDAPHFEILVRMRDEDGKILSPAAFMPAAERYQLMPAVDRWIIRSALRKIGSSWSEIEETDAVFCINLSGQSLTNNGFQAFVIDEITLSGVNPKNICFEITETAAISNIDEATAFMMSLKALGCRFALDDFGAGLSSFGYLKVLPVDYLKIDGSFVRDMMIDKVSMSMVTAIYHIGRTMGLLTIAEYVENDDIANGLRLIGVDYVQGFGIGKPVPLRQILQGLQGKSDAATA